MTFFPTQNINKTFKIKITPIRVSYLTANSTRKLNFFACFCSDIVLVFIIAMQTFVVNIFSRTAFNDIKMNARRENKHDTNMAAVRTLCSQNSEGTLSPIPLYKFYTVEVVVHLMNRIHQSTNLFFFRYVTSNNIQLSLQTVQSWVKISFTVV